SSIEMNDFNPDIDWLERVISENYIKCYGFTEFTNWEEDSCGSYGNVSCANCKGSETIIALKHSYNLSIKEMVNEVNYNNVI
ncbi:15597_t:CDS:1, partial [Funneliformis mosseae]